MLRKLYIFYFQMLSIKMQYDIQFICKAYTYDEYQFLQTNP